MSDDLIIRLRVRCACAGEDYPCGRCRLDAEAADEIQRLKAENERLLELCQPISACQAEVEFWDEVERAREVLRGRATE